MTTTPQTPWCTTGPCPPAVWDRVLARFSQTLRDTMRGAAGDLSLLCLAQMGPESTYGADPIYATAGNLLGLRPRPGDTRPVYRHPTKGVFLMFDSPTVCIAEWRSRILDPTYRGGIYTPGTRTIQELVNVYAPAGDGDNDPIAYARRICADMTFWTQGDAMPADTPTIRSLWVDAHAEFYGVATLKPGDAPQPGRTAKASRWDPSRSERDYLLSRCFERRNGASPKVFVVHIQQGTTRGSLDHWINGAYSNGQPVQASATVMIQRDGTILQVIPEAHGPWTNGKVSEPTAQSAYVRSLGGNVNWWSLTIEFEGQPNQPLTEAQLASGVWQIRDWSARYAIPIVPAHVLPHSSIDSVDRGFCPSAAVYDPLMVALIGDVPAPSHPYPPGITAEDCAAIWGTEVGIPFNPDPARGVASGIWVEKQVFSRLIYHVKDADGGRELFAYSSGDIIGRLSSGESFRLLY